MKKKRIGDYELGETLGTGTFGKVRRARNVRTGIEYAVKCIEKTTLKQRMRKQLKREISITKLIRHRNVVELIEVLASATKIYIVLELVTGGELLDLFAKDNLYKKDTSGLTEEKARHFFRQLVDGMICCHDQGVCHRDIKLENLLLDENENLKISDFGLSGLHTCGDDELTMTQSNMMHTSELTQSEKRRTLTSSPLIISSSILILPPTNH